MPDITDANATLVLSVPSFLPTPVRIQGFAVDDVFSTTAVKPVETQLGVDGFYAGGFVYTEKELTIMLNAASPSVSFFEAIFAGMEASVQAFQMQGILTLPALGRLWNLVNGYLTSYPPVPDAKRVLQPRRFGTTWQFIQAQPIGTAG